MTNQEKREWLAKNGHYISEHVSESTLNGIFAIYYNSKEKQNLIDAIHEGAADVIGDSMEFHFGHLVYIAHNEFKIENYNPPNPLTIEVQTEYGDVDWVIDYITYKPLEHQSIKTLKSIVELLSYRQ